MRVTFRPTVPADLPQVIGEPLPHRIRAFTALAGDTVLGIGALGFRPDGTVIAFAQINDEGRRYPVAIHRAGLELMKMIRESRLPLVVAEAQAGNAAAEPWLLRLGFRPVDFNGRKVFAWERSRVE